MDGELRAAERAQGLHLLADPNQAGHQPAGSHRRADPRPDGSIVGVLALPFGLALANGVTLAIDDGEPGAALPFQTCLPAGCLVQLKFGADKIADLGRAKQLKITATAADTGQSLPFTLSLKGFTQAAARTKALIG